MSETIEIDSGQQTLDNQPCNAGIGSADQMPRDNQGVPVPTSSQRGETIPPTSSHFVRVSPLLTLFAESLDDIERTRISVENRIRSMTLPPEKSGLGVPEDHPHVVSSIALLSYLKTAEKQATKMIESEVKIGPVGDFVVKTQGLGAKTCGRFLGIIGDPSWHVKKQRIRTVSELWAYCGLHVWNGDAHGHADTHVLDGSPDESQAGHCRLNTQSCDAGLAPRRLKGVKSNWNTKAKTRCYLIAESCMKNRKSPYRSVYDAAKIKYENSVHAYPCPQCHSKEAGTPLKPGHKHARAIRATMKAILLDLWRVSRGMEPRTLPIQIPEQEVEAV